MEFLRGVWVAMHEVSWLEGWVAHGGVIVVPLKTKKELAVKMIAELGVVHHSLVDDVWERQPDVV